MFRLFLKKANESPLRLILTALTFSLGVALSLIFMTVGVNSIIIMHSWFDKYPEYKYVYAEKQSAEIILLPDGISVKCALAANREISSLTLESYNLNGISITEYLAGSSNVIPGGILISGNPVFKSNTVYINSDITTRLNINSDDIVGKSVNVDGAEEYDIGGVFDIHGMIEPIDCILISENVKEADCVIIEASDSDDVGTICSIYSDKGYKILSYQSEIIDTKSRMTMVQIAVSVLSLLIVLASSLILYYSLQTIISDSFPFIAMIKAIGYKRTDFAVFVFTKSLLVLVLSLIIETILYVVISPGIIHILATYKITELFGFDIGLLFVKRLSVPICVFAAQTLLTVIISVICIRKTDRKEMFSILSEADQ